MSVVPSEKLPLEKMEVALSATAETLAPPLPSHITMPHDYLCLRDLLVKPADLLCVLLSWHKALARNCVTILF